MVFVETNERAKSHSARKEFLYGSMGKRTANFPGYLGKNNPQVINTGVFIPLKLNNNKRMRKAMWGLEKVGEFIKKVTEGFTEESQQREARVFAISVIYELGLVDFSTVRKLMQDNDDVLYMNSAYNVLAQGYHLFPDFDLMQFNKVSDMTVVNKTVQIIKDILGADKITDVEKKLEKYNGIETFHNERELPAIVVTTPGANFETEATIARNDFYDLEKEFGSLLQGYKYTFYESNGLYVLRLFDQTGQFAVADIRIDNGDITGIGKAMELPIFAFGRMDTILVNIKRHPDIIRWYLQSPQTNTITEEQYKEISKDLFKNGNIYFYVDFGTPTPFAKIYPILDALSLEDFRKFEKNLNKILGLPWTANVRMPRVRFKEFRNINDFALISDSNVHTTTITECCREVLPGLTITFKDGEITTDYNGSPLDFTEVANRPGGIFGGLIY